MRPIFLGFVAVAMSSELDGAGWKESVWPSLTLGLGHMCGSGKVVEVLEHITKHMKQEAH